MERRQWQAHVEACQSSGQSKKTYARTHDLGYSQLLYWTRKLSDQSTSRNFVAVKLKPDSNASDKLCVLEFPNGSRLIIHSPELLAQVPNLLFR
ncbi:MAG: hypothetical protein IIC10_06730 [Proteobacteria bacterium]|nr:hypothetical protein [Pseudomonadota bacterium]